MATTKTLDPKDCTVIITPKQGTIPSFPLSGWAEKDMLEYSYDEPTYSKKVTLDGEVIRVKSNNKSGKITLKLDENSSVIALISVLIELDKASNKGTFLISINSPNVKIIGVGAWFMKSPDGSKGGSSSDFSYEIDCSELQVFPVGLAPES